MIDYIYYIETMLIFFKLFKLSLKFVFILTKETLTPFNFLLSYLIL